MKRNRFKFFMLWLLAAVVCVPLTGCSGGEDEEDPAPIDNGKPEREKVYKTFTFDYFEQTGRYLVNFPDYKPSCYVIWGSKGTSFQTYLVDNGKIYYAGWAHSNDTILTEEERTSKALAYNVEIPTNISNRELCDVIALNNVDAVLSDGKIVCNADLKRDGSYPLWDHSGAKAGAGVGRSYALTTIEWLYVYNNTSDTITVRHKGFDAKEKWYYSKAKVILTADMQANGQGSSVGTEVVSKPVKVAPGGESNLWSYYVPTGKKMTDASLILEINGKEVKTPAISSEVDIENGNLYAMGVIWDGNSLTWDGEAPDNTDIPADAVDLALPSGTYWASHNIGATKPEEVGGYYAWGETESKALYTWNNYIHCDGSEETCRDIGNDIGYTNYDVAHVKWGGDWRMPSLEQWQEVIASCSRETTSVNGVSGLKLTSRKNGNSIFLPNTGAKWDSGCYYTENIYCWLSSLSTKGISYPYYLTCQGMGIGFGRDFERFIGLPVRPVMKQ